MKIFNVKKINKIVALLLLSITVLSLIGCSAANAPTNESSNSDKASNTVRITFPEGSCVSQMAILLEENGVCSAEDFMAAANDPSNLEGFDFEITEPQNRSFLLEGYLFPDTYDFYLGESANFAIKRFLRNTRAKITDDMLSRCDELGYTVDEILTIASIIQEEAGVASEMGKVSSVLHNRLNSPQYKRLQCDAATFYLRDNVKPYVSAERYEALLELYNTYKCYGLPAGPITNSGIEAVNAALYPEETPYFFFISDDNGVYHYAETWEEHLENCENAGLS